MLITHITFSFTLFYLRYAGRSGETEKGEAVQYVRNLFCFFSQRTKTKEMPTHIVHNG